MADELLDPNSTATTSSSSKDGYIGFLIFIKILAVLSMIASTFLVRDIYHKLCKKGSSSPPSSKREKLSMVWNISLTQSILVGLSVGDFFRRVFFVSQWCFFECSFYVLLARYSYILANSVFQQYSTILTAPSSFNSYQPGWSRPTSM